MELAQACQNYLYTLGIYSSIDNNMDCTCSGVLNVVVQIGRMTVLHEVELQMELAFQMLTSLSMSRLFLATTQIQLPLQVLASLKVNLTGITQYSYLC